MTDIKDTLAALSEAATQGALVHHGWGDGSTQMGMTNIFNEDAEVLLMECIPEGDAAFLVALWNAYRSGQLVPARAAAMSDLIAGDADMYDTPSARITGDKDRENPVEGAQRKPAVTQADVEIAEEIGQHMASYYEWGRPSDYQLAKESAALARELIAAQVEREIVAWLRACSLSSAIPDDPAQIIADLADAIEQGQHRSEG